MNFYALTDTQGRRANQVCGGLNKKGEADQGTNREILWLQRGAGQWCAAGARAPALLNPRLCTRCHQRAQRPRPGGHKCGNLRLSIVAGVMYPIDT